MGEWLVIIPAGFALAYAVFGGVEFGLSLAGVVHGRGGKLAGRRYLSPAWESTNMLLGAAVLAVVALYWQSVPAAWPLVRTIWAITLVLLVIRSLLVLMQYYGRDHMTVRWLLVVVSLALPAVLVQNVTVMMTGDANLLFHPYMVVTLAVLAVTMAVALWSGCFYRPGAPTREIARTSYWLSMLVAMVGLPIMFTVDTGAAAASLPAWPLVVTAIVSAACLVIPRRLRYFAASSVLAIGVGVTLLVMQIPYLIQPMLRLDESINPLAQLMVGVGFGLLILVMIPGALRQWARLRPRA